MKNLIVLLTLFIVGCGADNLANPELSHFNSDIDYIGIIAETINVNPDSIEITQIEDTYYYVEKEDALFDSVNIEVQYNNELSVYIFIDNEIIEYYKD